MTKFWYFTIIATYTVGLKWNYLLFVANESIINYVLSNKDICLVCSYSQFITIKLCNTLTETSSIRPLLGINTGASFSSGAVSYHTFFL